MFNKKYTDVRNFVNNLGNLEIRPYIDLEKFCKSDRFEATVDLSIELALKHDFYPTLNLLDNLLEGTPYGEELLSKVRKEAHFFVAKTKTARIRKATPDQIQANLKRLAKEGKSSAA